MVKLSDAPLVVAQGESAKQRGRALGRAQAVSCLATLKGKQDGLMASVRALGGVEVSRLSKTLNAVVVSIDAKQLPAVAALPGVLSVRGVKTYQRDLPTRPGAERRLRRPLRTVGAQGGRRLRLRR